MGPYADDATMDAYSQWQRARDQAIYDALALALAVLGLERNFVNNRAAEQHPRYVTTMTRWDAEHPAPPKPARWS